MTKISTRAMILIASFMVFISASALDCKDLIKQKKIWFMTDWATCYNGEFTQVEKSQIAGTIMTFETVKENGNKYYYLNIHMKSGVVSYRVIPDGDVFYLTGTRYSNSYTPYDSPARVRLIVKSQRSIILDWNNEVMSFERLD